MNTSKSRVLLFQPSESQAIIWCFALRKYEIAVIWNKKYIDKQKISSDIEKLESEPKLLIIDLKINNVYEICRYFREHYPSLKIIVTIDLKTDKYKELVLHRWLINQGVDEVLTNFKLENLLSALTTNINCVLKNLEYPVARPEDILRISNFLKQKNVFQSKNLTTYPAIVPLNIIDKSTQYTKKIETKVIFSFVHWSIFFIAFFMITATCVNGLYLTNFLRGFPRRNLVYAQDQTKDTSTNNSNYLEVNKVPQGIYNYGGSTTWASIRQIVSPRIAEKYPEFNIRYVSEINSTPGSGTGIRMLLEGELDFSQSSRSIEPKEHILAHQQGFTLKNYHIAIDAITVAVHPSLPVSGLTMEQLKKIYTGQIVNWKEVNGPDLAIVPLSRRAEDGGTPKFFQHHVLQNESFSSNVKYVYSTTDGLKQLLTTPGGIYYASAPAIIPQCTVKSLSLANEDGKFISPYLLPLGDPKDCPKKRNRLNTLAIKNATYPITRYLSVIVKQDGDRAQKAGEAYAQLLLKTEMQRLIERAGFVPINNVKESKSQFLSKP